MITAAEARAHTEKCSQELLETELNSIEDLINEACKDGENYCQVTKLSNAAKNALIDQYGYVVDSGKQFGKEYISIKW